MSDSIGDLQEHEKRALGEAAAEYRDLKHLVDTLVRLEYDEKHGKAKHAQKLVADAAKFASRKAGRGERSLDRAAQKVESDIAELEKHLPGQLVAHLRSLSGPMHVAVAQFTAELSRVGGALKGKFENLGKSMENAKDDAGVARVLAEANALIADVKRLSEFLLAYEQGLRKYRELLDYLEKITA